WRLGPVDELNTELEGGVARPHPLLLRNAKDVEKLGLDARHRAFSDPDRRDRGGLNQGDVGLAMEPRMQQGRTHPAGSAATEDDDVLDAVVFWQAWRSGGAHQHLSFFSCD